jgi:hypothetical protein
MVPKVAGKGSSFKGAALYYLHDKGALTDGRVWFTQTENLPTLDAHKAVRCMAYTAMNQQQIKARAGGSAKGRKLAHPVYTYSLSWAPGEDPAQDEMIDAAQETLRALGLHEHEALLVAHNDEPHPHIHVIVNRVHPETGIAAKLSNDHLQLSAWAEEYEKRQGLIRCEQRVENNARRRDKQFVKDRESQKAAEFHRWRRERLKEQFARREKERDSLSGAHKQQRESFYAAKEQQIDKARTEQRERHRMYWRALYLQQETQQQKLRLAQRTAWARLKHFLQTQGRQIFHAERGQRTGILSAAFDAVTGGPKQFEDLKKKQAAERAALAGKIGQRRRETLKQINRAYQERLTALRDAQRKEQDALKKRHTEESQKQAKDIKAQRDKQAFRAEQSRRKYEQIKEQKRDLTKPRSKLDKEFEKAKGEAAKPRNESKEETKQERRARALKEQKQDITRPNDKRAERSGKRYSAFRDMKEELTRDKGRERTRERKPPKTSDSGPSNGQ